MTASPSSTWAASTAPMSTANGSMRPGCAAATPSRSDGSTWCSAPPTRSSGCRCPAAAPGRTAADCRRVPSRSGLSTSDRRDSHDPARYGPQASVTPFRPEPHRRRYVETVSNPLNAGSPSTTRGDCGSITHRQRHHVLPVQRPTGRSSAGEPHGLFFRDARLLSNWSLLIDGHHPQSARRYTWPPPRRPGSCCGDGRRRATPTPPCWWYESAASTTACARRSPSTTSAARPRRST